MTTPNLIGISSAWLASASAFVNRLLTRRKSGKRIVIDGIAITSGPEMDLEKAVASVAFRNWLAALDRKRIKIKSVLVRELDLFANGKKVGFINLTTDATDAAGTPIPNIVALMRGGSVAILVVLECEGELWVPMTRQPRLPTGKFDFLELPAGMLDGSGCFVGVAATELKQELGLELRQDQLTDLTALAGNRAGIFLSPGGSDETMSIFYHYRRVSRVELEQMRGKRTGEPDEYEQITVEIRPLADLCLIPDAKTVIAYAYYQRFIQR